MILMSRFTALVLSTLVLLSFISCKQESSQENFPDGSSVKLTSPTSSNGKVDFRTVSAKQSGLNFVNRINETPGRSQIEWDYFYNGGGVAMADFDNDGLTDIFLCGNDSPNGIYRNKGNFQFEDKTSTALPNRASWTIGATIVDINNDGWQDIYVCNTGPDNDEQKLKNQLLINNGNFTFTDKAADYGVDLSSYSVQADFFDYDNDGDLDLWVNNHGRYRRIKTIMAEENIQTVRNNETLLGKINKVKKPGIAKSKSKLLRNDGGKFTDVSVAAGVSSLSFGLGLSIADYNDDGNLDVYVANDYWIPDYYYINNGDGKFTSRSDLIGHNSFFAMGSDAADYNNDNLLDLVVVDMTPKDHFRNKTLMESMDVKRFNLFTHMAKFTRQYMFNSFQVGVGNGYFSEIANALDVGLTDWSWAPLLFDMDNDGHNDLYITNGYFRDTKNQDYRSKLGKYDPSKIRGKTAFENLQSLPSIPVDNAVFRNTGNSQFENITKTASNLESSFSNGAAYADLDNDGDLDIVINNLNSQPTILQNRTSQNNYLRVILQSKNEADVKFSKLVLHSGDQKFRRDYAFTRGYASHMEPVVHFGIGQSNVIDSLTVKWPSGKTSTLTGIEINQTLKINASAQNKLPTSITKINPSFINASNLLSRANAIHAETFFDDFKKEVLLPQKYSTLGPALSVGDINKDGISEFYLGGSAGYPGKLFSLQGNSFVQIPNSDFDRDSSFEDLASVFIDVNSDGLLDLYVSSGGGGDVQNPVLLNDRIYINQGNGQFKRDVRALKGVNTSTKAIVPLDFDNDGDIDLFVGGRNSPGKYPELSESYLLENTNGTFDNIISQKFKDALPNMVTSASPIDINGDEYMDLVVCGEWSSPIVFINDGSKGFSKIQNTQLDDLSGWWYSVKVGDFDKNGKDDIILGNLGLNNKFHASSSKPLNVLYDDFDGNGSHDIFLTKKYKGKTVPVRGKECSSEQMPGLLDKFGTYESFASSSIADILGKDKVSSCGSMTVTSFESLVLLRKGDGFEVMPLPFQAQWSPILDMEIIDVNRDGNLDVIVAGNIFNAEPETPSYDAGKGYILYGKGDGNFDLSIDTRTSGLMMNYNAKEIAVIPHPAGYGLLVANNNGPTQLFIKN